MSFGDGMNRRAVRLADERRARLAAQVATRCDELPGVRASVSGDEVEVTGQGLLRRWLEDSRLRFAGRGR